MNIHQFVQLAIEEDIKKGDHSALACIPSNVSGSAKLLVKEDGIIAGINIAKEIFNEFDTSFKFDQLKNDGDIVKIGDVAFTISGFSRKLLSAERLVLNVMQRMSAIATLTSKYVKALDGLETKVLDTRKTTPLIRFMEKEAVVIGGGRNHRMGLYDMIMLKDNHIDFAGGIAQAIDQTKEYLLKNNLNLKIEIETRNLEEVKQVITKGGINRIMLDNFSVEQIKQAVVLTNKRAKLEVSGNMTLETLKTYSQAGVDFISSGALTKNLQSIDLSMRFE